MDNIQEKIAQIMSDPEAISQVQSLGKMLGLSNQSPVENKTSTGSVDAILNNNRNPVPVSTANINNGIPTEMMSKIVKLMPLFQQINQEDDVTRLLQALRPFLSEEKCRKLDSAKKMLQMMKIIPLLKEGGIIDLGFF